MKRFMIMATLIFLAVGVSRAQDIAGDWQGTLSAGGQDLRLVLHVTKAPDNSLKATLDSIDQPGGNGIPVSSISLKDSRLNLGVEMVHGTYEGKVAADGNTITGTWTQGVALPLEFKRAAAPVKTEHKEVSPSDIDGAWMGTLDTGAIKLRVAFHIVNTENGLTATLDSLDQSSMGMATSVTRDGSSLKIEVPIVHGNFEGKISADLSSIDGKWSQGGGTLPLLLKPVKDKGELELKRPQNPVKPYPYHDEDVSYENKAQNITLAATLTIPQGKGPFPRSRADYRLRTAGSRRKPPWPQAVPGSLGLSHTPRNRRAACR